MTQNLCITSCQISCFVRIGHYQFTPKYDNWIPQLFSIGLTFYDLNDGKWQKIMLILQADFDYRLKAHSLSLCYVFYLHPIYPI